MHLIVYILLLGTLGIGANCSVAREQDGGSFHMVNPAHQDLRWVGLWLAAHKYFEVDRRKGNELSWKYAPRVFHKHFPIPRLKKLHPEVVESCDKGIVVCVRNIAALAKDSYSLFRLFERPGTNDTELPGEGYPFDTVLELFRYRTTVSYYLCWYTMQRSDFLMNYMEGANCLSKLDRVQEKQWADIDVIDYRNDSYMNPFVCALIQFCPDPCYGKKTGGSLTSPRALTNDEGNPCRDLTDQQCKWNFDDNIDFESLQRNRFNISCNCDGDRPGFEWNSRFGLCVDKDECVEGEDKPKCRKGKVCQNLVGSYTCICRRGHTFDKRKNRCIERIPLPPHSRNKPIKTKPVRQKTALSRMLEYLLGLRKSPKH